MDRYQFIKQLGDGTYGSVILANVIETGEKVAIKKYVVLWKHILCSRTLYENVHFVVI